MHHICNLIPAVLKSVHGGGGWAQRAQITRQTGGTHDGAHSGTGAMSTVHREGTDNQSVEPIGALSTVHTEGIGNQPLYWAPGHRRRRHPDRHDPHWQGPSDNQTDRGPDTEGTGNQLGRGLGI